MTKPRTIMVAGAAFIVLSQIYIGFFGGVPLLAVPYGIFGAGILFSGYLMHKWENKWIGRRSPDKDPFAPFKFVGGDASVAIIPPPKIQPTADPVTGQKHCSFYFYDAGHRLPCLSGCNYPEAGRASCTLEKSIPTCPYPVSRQPLVVSMMPKPVAWCPGPGGCKHFDEREYTCGLKLKGMVAESIYAFDSSRQNRNIGTVVVLLGAIPGFILFLMAFNEGQGELALGALFMGAFIASIGAAIITHTN